MPRNPPTSRPGYEPGLGQPDPQDRALDAEVRKANVTHYADGGRQGPVCGIKPIPTDAAAYDPSDPSCPACLDWLTKTRDHTARKHGPTIATNEAMARAAEAAARKTAPKNPPQNPAQEPPKA